MKIIKIISEWKKKSNVKNGYKRVEAIVDNGYGAETKHIDIKK